MDELTHYAIRQQQLEAGRPARRHHIPLAAPPHPTRRRAARRLRRIADALDGGD